MNLIHSLHHATGTLRTLAVDVAYGVHAGNAIRHGRPASPQAAPTPRTPPTPPTLPTPTATKPPTTPARRDRDTLVASYLEGSEVRWRWVYDAAVRAAGPEPAERLLAVFDALRTAASDERLRQVAFGTDLAAGPSAQLVVDGHRRTLRDQLIGHAAAAGAPDPEAVSAGMLRLIGAATSRPGHVGAPQMSDVPHALATARAAAADLLGEALRHVGGVERRTPCGR